MKSFFGFALCFVTAVFAQCDQKPESDLDIYFVFDTRSGAQVVNYRNAYATGLETIIDWYAEAGKEVKGAIARAHPTSCSSCLHANVGTEDSQTLVKNVRGITNAVCYGHSTRPGHFLALIFRQMTAWLEPAKKSEVRRIMLAITGGEVYNSEKVYNINWARGSNAPCPVNTYGTLAQQQVALQRTNAGLGVIICPSSADRADLLFDNWSEYVPLLSITDYTIRRSPLSAEGYTAEVVDVVKQLSCPSWIATTTTGTPRYSTADREECFNSITHRCVEEFDQASVQLNRCLVDVEVRELSSKN